VQAQALPFHRLGQRFDKEPAIRIVTEGFAAFVAAGG
jgi:hypothetical protein